MYTYTTCTFRIMSVLENSLTTVTLKVEEAHHIESVVSYLLTYVTYNFTTVDVYMFNKI